MRRSLPVLLSLVLLLGGDAVAARQNDPAETEIAPGITAAELAGANLDALPADASILFFTRFIVAPGATAPAEAGAAVGIFYIESGSLTITETGAVSLYRAGSSDVEITAPGTEMGLVAGDAIYATLCTRFGYRNSGSEPVSVLVGYVTGFTAEPCPGATPETDVSSDPGFTTDFIGLGAVEPLPALPAHMSFRRLTFAAGVADPEARTNAGTVVARLDSGSLGVTMVSGEAIIVRNPPTPEDFFTAETVPLVAGVEAILNPGDMLSEASGTVTQVRNSGVDTASLVSVVLTAAAAEPATPTS